MIIFIKQYQEMNRKLILLENSADFTDNVSDFNDTLDLMWSI
jgi:hypothetical protein